MWEVLFDHPEYGVLCWSFRDVRRFRDVAAIARAVHSNPALCDGKPHIRRVVSRA